MKYLSLFLLFTCQMAPQNFKKKVVMISIDGFRPEFYSNKNFEAPTLKKLADEGVSSEGMVSIFPSVTYPNHTTLVTGVKSEEHGILSNTKFNWRNGPTTEWYWFEKDIKVKTLWDELRAAKKTSASIHWPVTAKAPIDFNVPEIFKLPPWHTEESFTLANKFGSSNLANQINKKLSLQPYTNMKEADMWAVQALSYLYQEHQPDFSALHIIYADKNQHETGRDSSETKEAVKWIDSLLTPFIKKLDKKTCLLIVGDHGFMNYRKVIHINSLFYSKGWIKLKADGSLKSFQVIAQKSGGQAAVYLKDQKIKNLVMRELRLNQKLGYQIVSKKDLRRLKAFPEAIAALSAKDGFSLGGNLRGEVVEISDKVKGQHGHLPHQMKMHTGFIAHNCGLERIETTFPNTQIAPTIKKYLGLKLSSTEKPLKFKEKKKDQVFKKLIKKETKKPE